MMNDTSCGVRKSRMEQIIAFMHTDLPMPVAPATSRCGILARSATRGRPTASRPRMTGMAMVAGSMASTRSRITTASLMRLGTSMPIVVLFGSGATMRMPSLPSFIARSFSKPSTLFTRRPWSSRRISYWVTTGPRVEATTWTPMSKSANTCSMALLIGCFSASCSASLRTFTASRRSMGGST